MNRLGTFATTTIAVLCLAFPGSDAFAQGKSLKEQLVGTWTMVSNVNMRPDGSKYEALGPNPRGVFMLDAPPPARVVEVFVAQNPNRARPSRPVQIGLKPRSSRTTCYGTAAGG